MNYYIHLESKKTRPELPDYVVSEVSPIPTDEELVEHGFANLHRADWPAALPGREVSLSVPELVDGVWIEGYTIDDTNLDIEEYMRRVRNDRLMASDWLMISDYTHSNITTFDRDEWVTYRQALRDMPMTFDSSTIESVDQIDDHLPEVPIVDFELSQNAT